MSEELFSVWQYLAGPGEPDENAYVDRVRIRVPLEEALRAVKHYTRNVTARIGVTRRVIIVDSGDYIVFEWIYGKGVVFPPKESNDQATS